MIAGLLLLGSTSDYSFTDTAAFKKKIPVYLGHGGKDSLINWK